MCSNCHFATLLLFSRQLDISQKNEWMPDDIPLLRAGVMDPIVLMVERMGLPTRKMFRDVGLPDLPWEEVDPYQAVSLKAGMDFLERVANTQGLPLFGMQVVEEQSLAHIRSLPLHYRNCANLKQLIGQFIEQAQQQSSLADYRLIEDGELVWLIQWGLIPGQSYLQTDLFTVSVLIQLIRSVTGSSWVPSIIHMSGPPAGVISDSDELSLCEIRFNQPNRGIAFPRRLLCHQIDASVEEETLSGPDNAEPLPGKYLGRQLEALLPAYLSMPGFNHTTIEHIAGMSFRTLQRKLRREGESYSNILERVRMRLSESILRESDEKISEIARQLGYSNTPNFIRAFRGWTGVTPGEYRAYSEASRHA